MAGLRPVISLNSPTSMRLRPDLLMRCSAILCLRPAQMHSPQPKALRQFLPLVRFFGEFTAG